MGRYYSRVERRIIDRPVRKIGEKTMQQEQDELLKVGDVALLLRVSPGAIRFWIRNHQIEAENIRPHSTRPWYRIRRSTVNALINQGQASHE